MTSVLDDIIVGVREDLEQRKQQTSLPELEVRIQTRRPALDVLGRFREPGLSVISEVKRSSPSKGALASIDDPASLASRYQEGGASAISVLTEKRRFNGSLTDLDAVRQAVEIPVLRKDFVVDDYQVWEARAHGADLVLLIVAALSDEDLARLHRLVLDLGMTPLVEVHTEQETQRAVELGAQLIGVNNRNLKTLEVDLAQFGRLVDLIGEGPVKVAESGILTADDAALVHSQGADVVLVGEALVRHGDPAGAIRAMVEAAGAR
ncbi:MULTISPECIES: indole-3-glycerol phosphate synthase TrpC [unclassified Luteococcus]|uniref:indole-3-glycerol phosphate synthase TrpC n=1 Tax=unclassified Luteococcus TaxID=2639923 RepID=UPI00313CB08B